MFAFLDWALIQFDFFLTTLAPSPSSRPSVLGQGLVLLTARS